MYIPRRSSASPRNGSFIVFALTIAMLASWLPHYLFWPWWPDADAWATIALGWDSGIRPYRDLTIFNFPGQIEICWLLGKLFGWGKTWPFYAFDAALLLSLGPLLVFWSRARLDRSLPGLIGWATTVWFYCGLNYTLVAQRDWQGPLLALASLAAIQTLRGKTGAVVSAGLMALGFAIRPHVVLFFPAIGLAVWLDSKSWRHAIRNASEWSVGFVFFVVLLFSPLIVQGLIPDFVRGVREARTGQGYVQATFSSVLWEVGRQVGIVAPDAMVKDKDRLWMLLAGWKVLATLAALIAIMVKATPERRRSVAPWIVALMVALLYKPLHPKSHVYLALPLKLVWGVVFGLLAGVILERFSESRPWVRQSVLLLVLVIAMPGIPVYCLPREALDAIRGREQIRVPATARLLFKPGNPDSVYRWSEYQQTLAYLRSHTSASTRVSSIIRNLPFPAINGPVGRISPLPAESGVIWLWSVNPKLEPAFVRSLEDAPAGSVVVWAPSESPLNAARKLELLPKAVTRSYRPEAKFGVIEIWRK